MRAAFASLTQRKRKAGGKARAKQEPAPGSENAPAAGTARGNDNAMAKRRGGASSRGWLWALTSLWSEHSDERANVPIIDTVLFDAAPVLQGHPYQRRYVAMRTGHPPPPTGPFSFARARCRQLFFAACSPLPAAAYTSKANEPTAISISHPI